MQLVSSDTKNIGVYDRNILLPRGKQDNNLLLWTCGIVQNWKIKRKDALQPLARN